MLFWNCFGRYVHMAHLRGFIVGWSDHYVVEQHDMELKARQLHVFPMNLWYNVSTALLCDTNTCYPRILEEQRCDFTVEKKSDWSEQVFLDYHQLFNILFFCQSLLFSFNKTFEKILASSPRVCKTAQKLRWYTVGYNVIWVINVDVFFIFLFNFISGRLSICVFKR